MKRKTLLMNTKLINFARIARKYFSEDITRNQVTPVIDEAFLDKYLHYIEDHPEIEAILKDIDLQPFYKTVVTPLLEECGLKPGMSGLPMILFLSWEIDQGYIKDLSALESEEYIKQLQPAFMNFAEALGNSSIIKELNGRSRNEHWCEPLYQYWFR